MNRLGPSQPELHLGHPTPGSFNLGGYVFMRHGVIAAERDEHGRPVEYTPHERYARAAIAHLNPYGLGPFTKLTTARLPSTPGVYAIVVNGQIQYIGRTANYNERFGPRGYGSIQPKNCYQGGQNTNCKLNGLLLQAAKANQELQLYVHPSLEFKLVEARLLAHWHPSWNN